jgi:8-oxo-dGTP diphosphatase
MVPPRAPIVTPVGKRTATQVVVGAALLDGAGRVLVAQRAEPPALAGYWELPGGKVEVDEDERAALVRECREELAVDIRLGERLGPDLPIGPSGVLRVWAATIVGGQPRAVEHRELRWLAASELQALNWLPADLPLVPRLEELLDGSP